MNCWMCEETNRATKGRTIGVGPAPFTDAFARWHRSEHVAAFSGLDKRTLLVLDELVEWAEKQGYKLLEENVPPTE